MTDYEVAETLRRMASLIEVASIYGSQHDCNDCGKVCKHRPKWGESVRINCFDWRPRDDGRATEG